jgi:hypothetical protein
MLRLATLPFYLLLRLVSEVFSTGHIVCYALYAGCDWLALRITKGLQE